MTKVSSRKRAMLRTGALALLGGLFLYDAAVLEPGSVVVRALDVPVRGLPGILAGLKIGHISDLHAGGVGCREDALMAAVDACNREDVDVVAVTGDMIGSRGQIEMALEVLAGLSAAVPRLTVLGNHDHVYGQKPLDRLGAGLAALGVQLLCNQAVRLRLRGQAVTFVGVDDGYSERDDLIQATEGLGVRDFPRVLLTHYPEVAERLREGEFQLSLAGHSHAGQIKLPVLSQIVHNGHARTRYTSGLYWVNGNPLHVSPGLGMSGLPLRFRNHPEVTVLRLKAAASRAECRSD